jgi:hypothetical protein
MIQPSDPNLGTRLQQVEAKSHRQGILKVAIEIRSAILDADQQAPD